MRARLVAGAMGFGVLLLGVVTPTAAHRLDEYLQAAMITLSPDQVVVRLQLTAGVSAATRVLEQIDTDHDGVISVLEQQSYAQVVRRDLTLTVDGRRLSLTVVSSSFPTEGAIREGTGDIVLTFSATMPRVGSSGMLTFENRHQRAIAAYLVNALVPEDPSLRITSQDRARDQSTYRLDFAYSGSAVAAGTRTTLAADDRASLVRDDRAALVSTYFWHGMRHILSGFDHLLFLVALVLGAASLWDLVKVVTAFTVAHSTTLTLAALGWVHLPSGVVEPVIALSIVFVAVQNVFWPDRSHGRSRLLVAFAFGLFHGLGFAGGLLDIMHQKPTSTVLLAIVGFTFGIEAGNQVVLLPLYGLLQLGRQLRAHGAARRLSTLRRLGSAAVSVAGLYYLFVALAGAA
jgi:hydrogenase/urease accessory protein HupE